MSHRTRHITALLTFLVMVGGQLYLPVAAATTCADGSDGVCCCMPAERTEHCEGPAVGGDLCCRGDLSEAPSRGQEAVTEAVRTVKERTTLVLPRVLPSRSAAPAPAPAPGVDIFLDLSPPAPPAYLRACALLI